MWQLFQLLIIGAVFVGALAAWLTTWILSKLFDLVRFVFQPRQPRS